MKKKCFKCKKEKLLSEFRKDKTKKSGIYPTCTECKKKTEKIWREKNRDKIRVAQRKHYEKNKEIIKKKRRDNYNPTKNRARWLAQKIRAKKCIFCDKIGDRHHKDYNHPLDIVFLCKSHHKQVHDGTIKI